MKPAVFLSTIVLALSLLHAETQSLKGVAADLAVGIRAQGVVKVAVLPLVYPDNRISEGPLLISEQLSSLLAAENKIAIVERHRLLRALEELRLSETGMLDPQTAKSIGQLAGADVIVTGTLINLPINQAEVNARALLSKNGRIVSASRALIERTWTDRRRLDW